MPLVRIECYLALYKFYVHPGVQPGIKKYEKKHNKKKVVCILPSREFCQSDTKVSRFSKKKKYRGIFCL